MTSPVGLPSKEKLGLLLVDLRRELERLYGDRLSRLILYGSQARGDAREGSDIDVLIVLGGEVDVWAEIKRTSEIISDLDLKYDEDISRQFASEAEFSGGADLYFRGVRREGIAA